jgi:hypothetical protein
MNTNEVQMISASYTLSMFYIHQHDFDKKNFNTCKT